MRASRSLGACVVLPLLAGLAVACVGDVDRAPRGAEPAPEGSVVRAPDGSLRVPFLGGAFVTKNRDMPVDIEQAIAGEPTDHPVVVWAGD